MGLPRLRRGAVGLRTRNNTPAELEHIIKGCNGQEVGMHNCSSEIIADGCVGP